MSLFKTFTFLTLLKLIGCSGQKVRHQAVLFPSSDESNWVKNARFGVYEVVIPKVEDANIKYARPLPLEKLSYRERTDKFVGIGTAFSVEPNKFISAAHVMNPANKTLNSNYHLRDSEGNVYKIDQVLRFSRAHDIIEFDLETPVKNSATLKVADDSQMGDIVYTFGNAQGEGISIRGGQIASFTPEHEEARWNYIRFSAPASPGNSGGPLLNSEGKVVGIVVMKNNNENLNYAIPVSEAFKLPTDKALIQKKNVPVSMWTKTSTENMDLTFALPKKFSELQTEASTASFEFYKKLSDKFFADHESTIFPNTSFVNHYLRDQTYQFAPYTIDTDGSERWNIRERNYRNISLGGDRKLYLWNKDHLTNFVVSKPSDIKLEAFLNNHGRILEEIFTGINYHRNMADDKIRITSYGDAHETQTFTDKLGRPWHIGVWRHHFTMRTTILSCMAVPSGASCSMYEFPTNAEVMNVFDTIKNTAHLETLSYYGTLEEWKEYFTIDKKFLPESLVGSSFDFKENTLLSYNFGKMSAQFNPGKEFDEKSMLFVKTGLAVSLPLRHEVHGVSLQPRSDKDVHYLAMTKFKPTEDMPTPSKKKWTDLEKKHSPFDGKFFVEQNMRVSHTPKLPQGREVANEEKRDRIYLGTCKAELSINQNILEKNCSRFLKGLEFKK